MPDLSDAEALLAFVDEQAQVVFAERLLAVYAIGSLAHGGFSPLCSDVDAAIVLSDPLEPDDADRIRTIAQAATPLPFGDRLSIFWGSPASLAGKQDGGRFPPHDLLDLARFGRLLSGTDQRQHVAEPDATALLIASTEFAIAKFASQPLPTPEAVVADGPRAASKLVLFPVRFLYTAQTGEMGLNEAAVEHYLATHDEDDPRRALVAAAFEWRTTWAPDADTITVLGHAPGLYRELIDDLANRMQRLDRPDLVAALTTWVRRTTV